jgi:hypothetical protein
MSDTINIYAETGRNIIGDDSSPTFTFENTSSGEILKLQNAGGTGNQLSTVSCPTTAVYLQGAELALKTLGSRASIGAAIQSSATQGIPLEVRHTVISAPTAACMVLTNSCASGAFFEFKGFLASIASATSITRGIRVKFGDELGWVPVFMSGTYI